MLQLLCIGTIVALIIIIGTGTIVHSARFCSYEPLSNRFYGETACAGDPENTFVYPFWIDSNRNIDYWGAGCTNYRDFQIKCTANGRAVVNISNNLYYIRYSEHRLTFTIVDLSIDAQECPQPLQNISIHSARFLHYAAYTVNMTIFYNCTNPPTNVTQHIPCLDNGPTPPGRRSFGFLEKEISRHGFDWYRYCEKAVVVPVSIPYAFVGNPTRMNYTQALKRGFKIEWDSPVNCDDCELTRGKCWANETDRGMASPFHCSCQNGTTLLDARCPLVRDRFIPFGEKIIIGVCVGVGALLLSILILFRRKCYPICNSVIVSCRKKIKGQTNVEVFIQNNYETLSLQNYKYSDIKKMTNYFKDKLGQGGYGSVFKGKLHSGQLVVVKVLNESKGKGEDFINEVATIGTTNHINVVSLMGFCAEDTKQTLVYEFMENGSLEKFIHNEKYSSITSSFLGWEKLYQIALGIARGLEYLHRGCNTSILHFDIKPHNILLDKNFCPKISDFGLAKLCPTTETFVSMVGARGTIGYIAPEVGCRNFGGVSHKSDVYSYGMMVLEMVGGRENIDATVENVSEIYFLSGYTEDLKEIL